MRAPGAGFVRALGLDPAADALPLRRRIGVLAEQAGFYDWLSAGEYLRWIASLYQIRLDKAGIARLLEQVGLEAHSQAPIAHYSRGMLQRLALARALINQPELLILDEPPTGWIRAAAGKSTTCCRTSAPTTVWEFSCAPTCSTTWTDSYRC